MKIRRMLAASLVILSALSTATLAAAEPAKKEPVQQFFAPEQAPDPKNLPGATVVDDVHKSIPGTAPRPSSAVIASTQDGFWEGDVFFRFDRYSETSNQIQWDSYYAPSAAKLRGVVRMDNRDTTVKATVKYTQQSSGSHTFSATGSAEVTFGVKWAIIGKAEITAGISLTDSRTWTQSTTVEDTWDINPGIVGYTYSYSPAVASAGYAVYKGYFLNMDTEYYGETSKALSAGIPSDIMYSFKHVEAYQ